MVKAHWFRPLPLIRGAGVHIAGKYNAPTRT